MKKFILFTLLMFSIFSCFSKKTPPKNIESWLELHFPGQFDVLVSNLKMLDVMAQFKGEKQALLADKSDPEVQFLLDWQKGADSLGLSLEQVKQNLEVAKIYVAAARELFKSLKGKGLDKYSVGVIDQTAYIQVFLEPTPIARKQTLEIVKAVLDARPEQPQSSIFLELMEASSYQSEFKDIIPYGHWKTGMAWQDDNKIMALDFEWGKALKLSALMRHWKINALAKRSSQYQELARQEANEWAEKNLPKPWFMPSNRPYTTETLEMDEPAIEFGFPFYDQKLPEEPSHTDPEPKGYVVGTYLFDQKVFTKLRKQVE
ncbi:MAG: hypothetical protein ACKVU0_08170 [Saprospiraceae bacterium]